MRNHERIVLLETIARPLYWLVLLMALVVLLRGHNAPGGGFIGGLLAASASILWALAFSAAAAQRRLPLGSPLKLAAVGLLCAATAGLPALVLGKAFLFHYWGTLPLGFTDYAISTVLLFDAGVFLCVWGAVSGYALALIDLGREGGEL
ncbi:Na(+)/H(+) antiporter subunit B [Cardiobacteriaceae bacterium TAE3-ERU3]|nr:Na(+)/H(+) antiporter subunit B [Cardiobacteriaceae bacterium TAE3-ERU3]